MKEQIWGILALLTFASPFVALIIIIFFKLFWKKTPASKKTMPAPALPRRTKKENPFLAGVPAVIMVPFVLGFWMLGGITLGLGAGLIGLFIYIQFIFPLGMGFMGGNLLVKGLRMAKFRKVNVLVLSLLMTLLVYGSYQYGRYIGLQLGLSMEISSTLDNTSSDNTLKASKVILDHSLKKETGYSGLLGYLIYKAKEGESIGRFYRTSRLHLNTPFTLLYWLMEFGIILMVVKVLGTAEMRVPTCEFCGVRYGRENHLGGTSPDNQSLVIDLIKRKDFEEMGRLIKPKTDLPSIELYAQQCGCEKGISYLTVRRAFQGAKGNVEFTDMLTVTLQPRDGRLLAQDTL